MQFVDAFYDNHTDELYETADGKVKINTGAKISRAFKFFIKNKIVLERLQNLYSELIQ